MLRITRLQEPGGRLVLKLEGRLLEPWVDELHRECELLATGAALAIDLRGLHFADSAGVQLLRALADRGASFVGGSAFMADLLDLPREGGPNPGPSDSD